MEYISSKKIGHVDGISRLVPKNTEPKEETEIVSLNEENELSALLINIIRELQVNLEDIRKATETDSFIQQIKKQVKMNERNEKGTKVSTFSTCDQTIMYPTLFTKTILKEFQTGHTAMFRMKSLMRSYIYWPRIDQYIEKITKECRGCQQAAKTSPIKTQPWPKTDIPWMRVCIDCAGPLNGCNYLIIIDSFSKWQEIYKFRYPTSSKHWTKYLTALGFQWH